MKFITARFATLRKEIQYLFLISSISILLIELLFKNWQAPTETFFRAGDIYLRLCYSLTATMIFFFISQHIPKEERKIKTYLFQKNKLNIIHQEISILLGRAGVDVSDIEGEISVEKVYDACSRTKVNNVVYSPGEADDPFPNWYSYLLYKSQKINGLIDDLMTVQELINSNSLNHILAMQPKVVVMGRALISTEGDLTPYTFHLKNIFNHSIKALEAFEALPALYVGQNSAERFLSFQSN